MPTRSERKPSAEKIKKVKMSTSNGPQSRVRECQKKRRGSLKQRSRSHSVSSSSSTSSSTSSSADSTSGTSSESSNSSGSSGSSIDSGDGMAGGNDDGSRDMISNPQQKSNKDDIHLRNPSSRSTGGVTCGRSRSSASPTKPEIKSKTTSGREVADIVCLSPSKIEPQTTRECSVIPVNMASSVSENCHRTRIRIALGRPGKTFPVPMSQFCTSDSFRSISLYSDDEVDCNDDGRSLDRPRPLRVTSKCTDQVDQNSSTGKCEVPQSTTDSVLTIELLNQKTADDAKSKITTSQSEIQDPRNNPANVDDRSRLQKRQRPMADKQTEQVSLREESQKRDGSSVKKICSFDVPTRSSRQCLAADGERRSRSDQSDGNTVSVDRGVTTHEKTAVERYKDISPRHEPTRSGCRNEVSVSRSRDRRNSRSRSPSRHNRYKTGSGSRPRTMDHRQTRAEVDDQQRHWSKHDVSSVSGRHSDRQTSRARPDSDVRYWRQQREKEAYVKASNVPYYSHQSRHNNRSGK